MIANKYVIAIIAFAVWMMFFDKNDVPLQIQRINELSQLEESEQMMSKQIEETKKELELLKTNPETLEKYAREKYYMKKDNEDLFIVTIDSSKIK